MPIPIAVENELVLALDAALDSHDVDWKRVRKEVDTLDWELLGYLAVFSIRTASRAVREGNPHLLRSAGMAVLLDGGLVDYRLVGICFTIIKDAAKRLGFRMAILKKDVAQHAHRRSKPAILDILKRPAKLEATVITTSGEGLTFAYRVF